MMISKKHRTLKLFCLIVFFINAFSWAIGASREIRPISQLTGVIVGPIEERKQVLSAGDKIFVSLDQARPVKKGDFLEIYQPTVLPGKANNDVFFVKMGQAIILEIINERLLLCVIHSGNREIAVGDRIYFPEN